MKKISDKYTSGVSALDNEDITKENYNPRRRLSRGLFITNTGKRINREYKWKLKYIKKIYDKLYSKPRNSDG